MGVTSGRVETNKISKTIFYVNWQQASQDTTNNQTTINWQAGINTGSSTSHDDYYNNAVKIYKVEINGETASNGGTWSQIHVGNDYQLLSGTAVIPHNADGSKTFNISITAWTFSSSNYSGSQNFTLNNIARQATADSVPDFSDEQNPVLNYTNGAGNAVTTLQACIAITESSVPDNPAIAWRDISKTGSSYTFELTTAEREILQNATTGQNKNFWFFIKTVLNGTTYYSYKLGKMTIVNGNPTMAAPTYADVNSTTTTVTGNNQKIIQNKSTLRFTFTTIAALKGATLSKISMNINGVVKEKTLSGSSVNSTTYDFGTIDVAENTTATIVLTDSRGFTTTYTKQITILEYFQPTAIITVGREANFYTESKIKVDANYAYLDGNNTIAIKFRQKKSTEQTYGDWTTIQDNVETSFNADNQYMWDIEVYLEDRLGTSNDYPITGALDIGIPLVFYDVKKRSVGINRMPANESSFEVGGDMEVTGDVSITGDLSVTGDVSITGTLKINNKDVEALFPVVLYNNSTGTNGNVTLSDSPANYSYIEVFYSNTQDYMERWDSVKVPNPNGKYFTCICPWIYNTSNGATQTITQINQFVISGNNYVINRGSCAGFNVESGGVWSGMAGSSFYIKKVIGYK